MPSSTVTEALHVDGGLPYRALSPSLAPPCTRALRRDAATTGLAIEADLEAAHVTGLLLPCAVPLEGTATTTARRDADRGDAVVNVARHVRMRRPLGIPDARLETALDIVPLPPA